MINRIVIVGRVAKAPEMRTTGTGKEVAGFRIAVKKRMKPLNENEPDAFFFSVSAWEHTARFAVQHLTVGMPITVEGRLEQKRYRASDGTERECYEIVADSIDIMLNKERVFDENEGENEAPNLKTEQAGEEMESASADTDGDEFDPFSME